MSSQSSIESQSILNSSSGSNLNLTTSSGDQTAIVVRSFTQPPNHQKRKKKTNFLAKGFPGNFSSQLTQEVAAWTCLLVQGRDPRNRPRYLQVDPEQKNDIMHAQKVISSELERIVVETLELPFYSTNLSILEWRECYNFTCTDEVLDCSNEQESKLTPDLMRVWEDEVTKIIKRIDILDITFTRDNFNEESTKRGKYLQAETMFHVCEHQHNNPPTRVPHNVCVRILAINLYDNEQIVAGKVLLAELPKTVVSGMVMLLTIFRDWVQRFESKYPGMSVFLPDRSRRDAVIRVCDELRLIPEERDTVMRTLGPLFFEGRERMCQECFDEPYGPHREIRKIWPKKLKAHCCCPIREQVYNLINDDNTYGNQRHYYTIIIVGMEFIRLSCACKCDKCFSNTLMPLAHYVSSRFEGPVADAFCKLINGQTHAQVMESPAFNFKFSRNNVKICFSNIKFDEL